MNLKKLGRTFWVIAAVAIMAMVLQGCGGDDGVSQGMHDNVVSENEELKMQVETLQGQLDALPSSAEVTALRNDLQALLNALNANDNAGALAEIKRITEALEAVETNADMMSNKAAKALYAVLANAADGDGTTAPIDGTTDTVPTVTVEVDDMMVKAMATDYEMADGMTDMITGWRGATLMNDEGDTVVVYSDIENPTPVMLFDKYDSTAPTGGKPRTYSINNDAAATDDMIKWTAVMRPDEMTSPGTEADTTTFRGSVDGVMGTFTCTGTCTAPGRFSDGSVVSASGADGLATGTWAFAPSNPSATVDGAADSVYLTFGWWLDKGADGMPADYVPITGQAGMAAATTTSTGGGGLRGSATWKGGAAGKYALPSTTDDTYDGGHFTAMATIMADFDVDNDADTAGNDRAGIKLSGMIDNFMTGDMQRNWMVKLMADGDTAATGMQPVDDLAGDLDAGTVSLATEWSLGQGGAVKGTGTWDPMFYHEGAAAPTAAMAPTAVTGTFNATSDIGRLQGAFGATKMDE